MVGNYNYIVDDGCTLVTLPLPPATLLMYPSIQGQPGELFSQNKIDGIVFTSVSSVRAFFEIMSKDYDNNSLLSNLEKLPVIAIGPFTSDELKKFNIKNTIAQVHTVLGAFNTIKSIFSVA